jgi:hypothetical protein
MSLGLRYDDAAQNVTAEGTPLPPPDNMDRFAEDADGEIYKLTAQSTEERA